MAGHIFILGIGNILMRDDGAGPRVIHQLQEEWNGEAGVFLLDGGTLAFTLLPTLCACPALIVVDAARLGLEPGAIGRFEGEAMDAYLRSGKHSAHEVVIADLLDMARLLNALPTRRVLIAIQAIDDSFGEVLSIPVAQAIPRAAAAVREIVNQWRRDSICLCEEIPYDRPIHIG